jgi:2-oxoisovalerate dehydrogenase E1 component
VIINKKSIKMKIQLDKNDLENVLIIRAFEESLLELFKEGLIGGTVHTCVGQEINPVIISKFKKIGDYVLSNHRGHGHFLAFNDYDHEKMFKEILGRNDGCCHGVGGSQHLASSNFLSNGIQGGMTPIGTGMAFGLKFLKGEVLQNDNNCVFAFIGDGTLGQGVLYESLNIAGKLKLPIVFVLEDNGIAQSTPSSHTFSGDLDLRVRGFGLDYHFINRIEDQISDVEIAINLARNFNPQFLHIKSIRLLSHSKGDDNRNNDFISNLRSTSPIEKELQANYYIEKLEMRRSRFFDEGLELKSQSDFFKFEKPIKYTNTLNSNALFKIEYSNDRYNLRINKALSDFLKQNPNSIILGEDIRDTLEYPCDVSVYGGAFKVTSGLSSLYPDRIFNFPISEQLIVGFSTGFSLINGWTICEIMFADFLTLTVDQVIQHLSKFKLMLGGLYDPKVIIRSPIGGYRGYGPTHSQSLEGIFIGIPNFGVLVQNKYVAPECYLQFIQTKGEPCLLLENKLLYTEISKELQYIQHDLLFNAGHFPIVYSKSKHMNSDFLVITYGQTITLVEEVAGYLLMEEEIGLDCLCYSDLNDFVLSENILTIVKTYKNILVLTESRSIASWSAQIGFELQKMLGGGVSITLHGNEWIVPASTDFEKFILPNKNTIIEWIQKFV